MTAEEFGQLFFDAYRRLGQASDQYQAALAERRRVGDEVDAAHAALLAAQNAIDDLQTQAMQTVRADA